MFILSYNYGHLILTNENKLSRINVILITNILKLWKTLNFHLSLLDAWFSKTKGVNAFPQNPVLKT